MHAARTTGRAMSRTIARNAVAFGPPPGGKAATRAVASAASGGYGVESEQLVLQLADLKRLRA
eukprot:4639881-Prorocentrum_lima.AAC.1